MKVHRMIRPPHLLLLLPLLALLASPLVAQDLPPESEYVVAKDGDLYVGDQRVRFWGGIGSFPPGAPEQDDDPYRHNETMMERIHAYGFNMWRIWGYTRLVRGSDGYTKGDGSRLDVYDHMIALARENGMRLWLGGAGANLHAEPQDVDILDDPDTADAWAQAIAGLDDATRRRLHIAAVWDERLERILIRNNDQFLNHVNQHTGLRVADDPVFAIWELNNEQWWIVHMVSGHWQNLPEFFQRSLIARWHDFLREKYGDEAALVEAWGGLKPGESLEAGTLYLAPLRGEAEPAALNDANPRAEAKFEGEPVRFGRDDFQPQRGADVNAFFASLLLPHKQRVAEAFKAAGRSTGLSPLLHDTGIGYNGIAQLMHQQADAVSHCSYIAGWTHYTNHDHYPWYSGLQEPPRLAQGVPWLEHNTVEGKPYFVYETQIGAPAKYRAEFPYRMAFLAALQDWDVVCWHTMSGGYNWEKEDPLTGPLAFPGPAAYQFTYRHDQTQLSAMHAAGQMFRHANLDPAPEPTTFIYGRNTIFHPDSMDYAGSYGANGGHMLHTAYQYGSRIRIDLDREDDEILGPVIPLQGYGVHPNPITPTDQMTYDWRDGYLKFDAPGAAAFVGFLADYGQDDIQFDHEVTISDVTLDSPQAMRYPVTDEERYVAIALTSTDGQPLSQCRTAVLSAVSTSHNQGLEVGPDPEGPQRPNHAWQAMKVLQRGSTPIEFTRVGCTVTSPHLVGMTYTLRNWHWEVIDQGTVGADGRLRINAEDPVFLVELER